MAGKGKREALNRVIERRESDNNVPDSWEGICQQIHAQKKVRTAGHRNHREQKTKYSAPIGSEVHQECREDGVDEIELRNSTGLSWVVVPALTSLVVRTVIQKNPYVVSATPQRGS